jgi:NAD+ synthase
MRERQHEIIEKLGVKPIIDPREEVEQRTQLLASYLREHHRAGYTLGISGGQDSLLVGLLAQRAVMLNRTLGYDSTFSAILLPYGTQADRADALLAIDTIKPDHTIDFNIASVVDAFVSSYDAASGESLTDFHKGNVKARTRMMAQYAVAGMHDQVVLSTDHAAEALVGFFTKFGDGAADIAPIATLNKRQGRQVLRFLDVPEVFITKLPTADLLDATPSQPDEVELGMTYEDLDDYLEGFELPEEKAIAIERRHTAILHKLEPIVRF